MAASPEPASLLFAARTVAHKTKNCFLNILFKSPVPLRLAAEVVAHDTNNGYLAMDLTQLIQLKFWLTAITGCQLWDISQYH